MSVKIGKLISHGNGGPDITNIRGNVEIGEMEVGYKITKFNDIKLYQENIIKGEVVYVGNGHSLNEDYPILDETEAYIIMKVKTND